MSNTSVFARLPDHADKAGTLPRKHRTLIQCWLDVGPASRQHLLMSRACRVIDYTRNRYIQSLYLSISDYTYGDCPGSIVGYNIYMIYIYTQQPQDVDPMLG